MQLPQPVPLDERKTVLYLSRNSDVKGNGGRKASGLTGSTAVVALLAWRCNLQGNPSRPSCENPNVLPRPSAGA